EVCLQYLLNPSSRSLTPAAPRPSPSRSGHPQIPGPRRPRPFPSASGFSPVIRPCTPVPAPAGCRFRVRCPGSRSRSVSRAGPAARSTRRGSGLPGPTPSAPSASSGPTSPLARAVLAAHGVPVRLLDVLPRRAAAAPRRAGWRPGPVPGAAPAQPPLPGGDCPLPAGAALPGRRGVRRWGRPGLGLARGLGRTGDRPGRPGLSQRRRRGSWGRRLRRSGSRTPGGGDPGGGGVFRGCSPLLTHGPGPATSGGATTLPVEEPIVSTDEVIFPLTVSLDRLPPGTPKAKIVVTVWKREVEAPEVRDQGYLRLLQTRSPGETFRGEQSAFKAQVSTLLTLLPPPVLKCRQFTVAGKHLTVLKVLNSSSQEEISIWDIRILPNFNASYLPVMPDGSVLLVDNVCHQSGEVSMGSFCRLPGTSGCFPCPLSALEEHNFLFQLRGGEQPPPGAKEGLEVPLIAVVQWSTPKLPFTQSIYTHYRLPSIRLDRPCFVMTASCESPVRTYERFTVTYTLLNNLQDFLAVRLVWTPEHAQAGKQLCEEERRAMQAALDSVVCHTPLNNLGFSRKGSALTFSVAFQALRTGLFELSQHMKLKLQFTASVSHPPPEARPLSRKSSPSSPAVRDLVERHQASLGRSQSFSHQQPSRSHLMRSGSVMERRAITPPVASPVGRPLYLPPDKAVLSLDKIAKRECKVLVVEPVK
uniref:Microtubule associated protein 11 n=1 Tax=Sus scrofa TaxID=9823 RepID=A0A4X1U7L8_PIG